ncbi:hypothetical protein FRC09_014278 [Ceratobasidium sp. 395]|nr:hypothetical protein FRC09_014278 [Ceratobasidium sp. 395]
MSIGDIISLVTPFHTRIIVNTSELASELLDKQAAATSDRPREVMVNEILGWSTSVGFHTHNERHKKLRRVLASALHPSAARSYASQHLDSTHDLLRRVVNDPANFMGSLIDVVGEFILRLAYGYKAKKNDPLLNMVREAMDCMGKATSTYFLVNDFPILKHIPAWFPGANFQRFGQAGRALRDRYANEPFETVFNQVRRGRVERPSYTSQLLEAKGGDKASQSDIDLVKWTAASMFAAGSTTTVSVISACFLMLSLHPEVVKTARAEIDSVIGRERIPTLGDRESLPYVDAVLQEVMRLCPVVPLGLTHRATEDIEFHGYHIPEGSSINANIWAILRDPRHYQAPQTFDPTRFLKPVPDPDPRKYIFGFGRRICPGLHVGNNSTWIMCAGILATLDVRPSPEVLAKVAAIGGRNSERLHELFVPYGLGGDPLPFSCSISPRDEVAEATIRNSAV